MSGKILKKVSLTSPNDEPPFNMLMFLFKIITLTIIHGNYIFLPEKFVVNSPKNATLHDKGRLLGLAKSEFISNQ